MKKIILLFIGTFILMIAGCSNSPETKNLNVVDVIEKQEESSLATLKTQIKNDGKLLGVAYLSGIEGDFEIIKAELLNKDYSKEFPFIKDIDKIAENEGERTYLVVPAEDVSVSVYKCEFDNEYMPYAGEELVTSTQPVIIRGNISDIIPNLYIIAQNVTEKVEYTPMQSGMDGKLVNSENKVYDFTPYDMIPEFND